MILRVLSTDQEATETKPNLVKYVKRLSWPLKRFKILPEIQIIYTIR